MRKREDRKYIEKDTWVSWVPAQLRKKTRKSRVKMCLPHVWLKYPLAFLGLPQGGACSHLATLGWPGAPGAAVQHCPQCARAWYHASLGYWIQGGVEQGTAPTQMHPKMSGDISLSLLVIQGMTQIPHTKGTAQNWHHSKGSPAQTIDHRVLRGVRMAARRENSQARLHHRQRDFITADKRFSDDTSDWSVSGKQLGPAQHVGHASRCYCSRDAQLEPPQPPAEAKARPNNQDSHALCKEEPGEVCCLIP